MCSRCYERSSISPSLAGYPTTTAARGLRFHRWWELLILTVLRACCSKIACRFFLHADNRPRYDKNEMLDDARRQFGLSGGYGTDGAEV